MTAGHQEETVAPVGYEVETDGPSPGEELRRAREAKGWSVEQVAERLRLHADQIHALERDDNAAFPALIFVSGYVRNYARLLNIDPAPLLASLQPVEASTPVIRAESAAPRRRIAFDTGPLAIAALLLAVLAAGLLIWFGVRPGPETAPSGEEVAVPSARFSPAEEEVSAPFDQSAMDEVREELARGGDAAPALAAADEPAVAELVLRFSGTSWIEVSDATGRRLAVRMGQEGDELRLQGQAPFEVLLGNAPNVSLEYNGSPYTDIPISRQNVANFKLGSADGQ